MEKEIRAFRNFREAEEADLEEWLALSGEERLLIGESMRQEAYGGGEQGLRRVLRVVEHV